MTNTAKIETTLTAGTRVTTPQGETGTVLEGRRGYSDIMDDVFVIVRLDGRGANGYARRGKFFSRELKAQESTPVADVVSVAQ